MSTNMDQCHFSPGTYYSILFSQVMLAASYWSLLAPAIEMAERSGKYGEAGHLAFLPVSIGFLLGAAFVYFADKAMPYLVGIQSELDSNWDYVLSLAPVAICVICCLCYCSYIYILYFILGNKCNEVKVKFKKSYTPGPLLNVSHN